MDKSFYDIGTSDLKELWDSDLEPVSAIVMSVNYSHLRNTVECCLDFPSVRVCVCVCVCVFNYQHKSHSHVIINGIPRSTIRQQTLK